MRYFIYILLFISSYSLAQEQLSVKKLDSIQFISSVNMILKSTEVDFIKIDSGRLDYKNYYKYANRNNPDERFMIVYTKRIEDKNIDLEIPGKLVWNIESVFGKFLTIFDLYRKFYSPNADKTKIIDMGQEWNKTQDAATIRRAQYDSPVWEIRIWKDF